MPSPQTDAPKLHAFLTEPLTVGEPDVWGPLSVFPLFGLEPQQPYVSFAQGVSGGVSIKELPGGASVNDLLMHNPTSTPVLLYEGEEVLGAQQNRTFDVSVLVGAGSALQVPVSCVEAGRWDGGRHSEDFTAAPQTAYPALRRIKNTRVRANLAAGHEARASQSEVWDEVATRSSRMSVSSGTAAMHDIYESRRARLNEIAAAVGLREGQVGTLVAVADRFHVLDLVSRPEVFGSLHSALVQGYALDAVEVAEADDVAAAGEAFDASAVLEQILTAPTSERDGIGLGREARFASPAVTGSALLVGPELVQLTAFPETPNTGADGPTASGRIRRPSRRRA